MSKSNPKMSAEEPIKDLIGYLNWIEHKPLDTDAAQLERMLKTAQMKAHSADLAVRYHGLRIKNLELEIRDREINLTKEGQSIAHEGLDVRKKELEFQKEELANGKKNKSEGAPPIDIQDLYNRFLVVESKLKQKGWISSL